MTTHPDARTKPSRWITKAAEQIQEANIHGVGGSIALTAIEEIIEDVHNQHFYGKERKGTPR